ncbi:PspC domain-containing protein [Micromonospora inositola]|uniref:Phage shock protein C (PspC) family protein n=1 Tax=Micromonospora inositola TaxID=47865 RepID=A0A1C5IF45_9ACTN|nr:PspC domain-containing protein [Micromonospora inositola]SCG56649.1 phage shock protein C (PspC) family protein [Micromonospora inositola]
MTEDAARPPQPGAAPPDGPPPPPAPAPAPTTQAGSGPGAPPAGDAFGDPSWSAAGPAAPPPGASAAGAEPLGDPPPGYAPPPGAAGFTSRYGLVRPREGRYLAGVCAAIGRATNTDPVLWRVLLAVLGFFGGVGILIYVAAWLIIPGEGDTASPVESMLGRGRSSMSPVTVIVLSILVAVSFGYIVTDAFRAVLLGAAILIGGALLLNREHRGPAAPGGPSGPPATPPGPVPPVSWPAPGLFTPPAGTPATGAPAWSGQPTPAGWETTAAAQPATSAARPAGEPLASEPGTGTAGLPTWPEAGQASQPTGWPVRGTGGPGTPAGAATSGLPAWSAAHPTTEASGWPEPGTAAWPPAPTSGGVPGGMPAAVPPVSAPLPPTGYRAPFAPRGPYAGPYPPVPPQPPARAPKPPKRPKERSPLGAVTFSLIFLALGVVAVLDLLDVFPVGAAGYFAAALATIGLGLLVGTWFGRARWLIALGLVTAAALGVATVAESYDRVRGIDGDVTWAPTDYRDLATRYENNFGDAVLDLRGVDFDKKETQIIVAINFGEATVVVPPNVDVTTVADVNAGDATVFGQRSGGLDGNLRESTDVGPDGPGGGKLRLLIHVNAGNLEVTR